MVDVRFTNEAVEDLKAIDDFSVAQFGEDVGDVYMRGFDEAFALLKERPRIGQATPEYGKSYRCFTRRSHRRLAPARTLKQVQGDEWESFGS